MADMSQYVEKQKSTHKLNNRHMCNHRKWIVDTLKHCQPYRVPFHFSFTPPVHARLEAHYGTRDVEAAIGMPMRMTGTKSIKPLYASPDDFGAIARDEFGVVWNVSERDRGSPVGPCLREPDLAGYRFPDPAATYRFEDLADWTTANADYYTVLWVGDLWERATFMRGMEAILMDVALNRRFVEELLRGLTDYILQTMEILFLRFSFDGVFLSDDYGTQRGMLISPADWRALIKLRLAEIYGLAKKHDRKMFHHSCGNIVPVIGDMIDLGLDVLHPIQPEAMDIFRLKREFGRHITLCGGVRTQDLLPHGTPQQVRDEVKHLKEVMGKGGGYILGNRSHPM